MAKGFLAGIPNWLTKLISKIEADVAQHTNDISSLETTVNSHDTDISSLETTVSSHGTDISSLKTAVNNHGTDISSLETAVNNHGTTLAECVKAAIKPISISGTVLAEDFYDKDISSTLNTINGTILDVIPRNDFLDAGITITWDGDTTLRLMNSSSAQVTLTTLVCTILYK